MDTRDLIPQAQQSPPFFDGNWLGEFLYTITDITTPAWVVIKDISPDDKWGPCLWMPRVFPKKIRVVTGGKISSGGQLTLYFTTFDVTEIVLPKKGDICLVAFDNNQQTWVVTWWPS